MFDNLDDNALLIKAKQGEYEAFEELVTRHEGNVFSTAMRILRQREDAEDCAQTSFLSALEGLGSFRGDSSFATWITRITVNAALKVLRKRQGLSFTSFSWQGEDEESDITDPDLLSKWNINPEELVERKNIKNILNKAIEGLSEKHRLVFVLRDVEGFGIAETADLLSISKANVKIRLLRARLELREVLTKVFSD
jgi:RNA polymerase sigma-70 factor, ECF subfamily